DKEAETARPSEIATAAAGGKDEVETDVERLLARARAAAARGDYGRAVDDAYAALLRRLDGDGLIRIHISRTNADYGGDRKVQPERAGPVRAVVRDVERVQFGAPPASAEVFDSVLGRVVPIAQRSLAAVLLVLAIGASLSCSSLRRVRRGPADDSPS